MDAIVARAGMHGVSVGKPKLVSLLANWYSGATLSTILLDSHSRIVSNGESMFFDANDEKRYDCTCGKFIDECEFYRATTRHMRRPGTEGWDKELFVHVPSLSRNPILRSYLRSWRYDGAVRERFIAAVPRVRRARDRFLEAQLRFFENARALTGSSIYLDGTKSIRRAQLFARSGCEMKAIHLIRDGRGFGASFLRNEESHVPTVAGAARAWLRYIEQVDGFSRAFPEVPVLTVRYEDVCRSTEATVRAVCRFLEIPYEDLTVSRTKGAHVLGHEMRRSFDGRIVENTSWRERLDPATQMALTSRMRPELERFGYV